MSAYEGRHLAVQVAKFSTQKYDVTNRGNAYLSGWPKKRKREMEECSNSKRWLWGV